MAETGTRPTNDGSWATSGSATISNPGGAKQALGWIIEMLPHGWLNWWWNLVGQWLAYFDEGRPRTFTAMEDAVDLLKDEQIGIVNEWDGSKEPYLDTVWKDPIAGPPTFIKTNADGRMLFVAYDDAGTHTLRGYNRESDTPVWTDAVSYTAITDIFSDGRFLWVAADNKVHKILRETGVASATWAAPFDHTAVIKAIYSTGLYVWMCGVADGGGVNTRVLNPDAANGPASVIRDWIIPTVLTDNHWDIEAFGQHAWVTLEGTNPGPPADNFHVLDQALVAPVASTYLSSGGNDIAGAVLITESAVFVSGSAAVFSDVLELDKFDPTIVIKTHAIPGTGENQGMCYDGRYVYVDATGGSITVIDPRSGDVFVPSTLTGSHFSADLFALYYTESVGGTINRLYTYRRPRMVRKAQLTALPLDGYRTPLPHMLIPFE